MTQNEKRPLLRRKSLLVAAILILLVCTGLIYRKTHNNLGGLDVRSAPRAAVQQGDMVITILQSGELKTKNTRPIFNESDRSRQITYVIEDGAHVTRGTLLVEFDSADLNEELMRLDSEVSSAEASLRQTEEQIAINQVQYNSTLQSAELRLSLAKLDLQKYLEAEYPQKVRLNEVQITLAREELSREVERRDWTRRLYDKGYANKQDLDANELAVTRKDLDLERAQEELRILTEYTHTKELQQLQNAISTAEADLERIIKTQESQMAQEEANLASRRTNLELKIKQRDTKQQEIDNTRIISQFDGQVFYPAATHPWRSITIEQGANVHGRMRILEFPDFSAWEVTTRIPESIVQRVQVGQKAYVTVDALGHNQVLEARVSRIAAAADQSWFSESAQKMYSTTLDLLTTSPALRPGMSVMAEIVTNELEDVTFVPIQSVRTIENNHFVYTIEGNRVVPKPVVTGQNNESQIQIVSGVQPGTQVLLYAPVQEERHASLRVRPLALARDENRSSGDSGTSSAESSPPPASPPAIPAMEQPAGGAR